MTRCLHAKIEFWSRSYTEVKRGTLAANYQKIEAIRVKMLRLSYA